MIELLTCRDVASLLTDCKERAIPWNQRVLARVHLRFCPECRELLAELEALPSVVLRFSEDEADVLAPIGETALSNALLRLKEGQRPRSSRDTAVPEGARRLLAAADDLPLRLLAKTHAAMMQGRAPGTEPYLPEEVLAELPPRREWKWRHIPGGIRRALLWTDRSGVSLSLVFMPPRYTLATHTHEGSESLLVLEGELEHEDRCLTNGDWIHLESGSSHSPHAFDRGCWCLVRDEGSLHYEGPLGWLKELMTGA